jgi:hypothetical protein
VIESKLVEPWRPPSVALSSQYDEPARWVSPRTAATLGEPRDGRLTYRALDAAQVLKHLLGIHSQRSAGVLPEHVDLVLVLLEA